MTDDDAASAWGDRPQVSWAAIGVDVTIYPLAKILATDRVQLGSHVMIDDFVFIGRHERLVIGNYVHIASHASITGGGVCHISDFANMSSGSRVITGTDDFTGRGLNGPTVPQDMRAVDRGLVVLGAHSLLGANAVVLPGAHVGEGAAVGAGSVVTKTLEPWTIHAGVPARPLRARDRDRVLALERELYERNGFPDPSYRYPPAAAPCDIP